MEDLGIPEPGPVPPPPAPTSLGPATPAEAEQPTSPDEAAAAGPVTSSAPVVLGVYCKNGHFTDPEARSCVVCGAGISRRSASPEPGPRPPLGLLVLDDGASVELDGDYVIGRDPTQEPSVVAGEARPLRVVDTQATISRVHARVHLDGWQVLLTDLGSANGTRIKPPGSKSDQQLDPEVEVRLRYGTRVFVGSQGLSFEPYRPG